MRTERRSSSLQFTRTTTTTTPEFNPRMTQVRMIFIPREISFQITDGGEIFDILHVLMSYVLSLRLRKNQTKRHTSNIAVNKYNL